MFVSKNISFLLAGVFSVVVIGPVTSSFSASGKTFCQNNPLETERCGAAVSLLRKLLLPEQPTTHLKNDEQSAQAQNNKEQVTTNPKPPVVAAKTAKQTVEAAEEEQHLKPVPLGFVPTPRLRARQFDPTQAVLVKPEAEEIKPAQAVQQAAVTKANFVVFDCSNSLTFLGY